MKFYISASGIKRVTVSNDVAGGGGGSGGMKGKGTAPLGRRLSQRTVFPVVLMLGIVLPCLFLRVAFIVLESAAICSSSLGICLYTFSFSGNFGLVLNDLGVSMIQIDSIL